MSCDVFISYRRQDGVYPAMLLHRDLIEAGFNVFYDIASLRSGEFPSVIEANIKSCTDFILLVTKQTFSKRIFDKNDWIRKEIGLAIEYKKNIIPVYIGNVSIPKELPEDIAKISTYQGVYQLNPLMIHEIHNKIFKEFMRSKALKQDIDRIVNACSSIYDSSYGDELERLKVQAQNSLEGDAYVIQQEVLKPCNVTVLDVGCAYGFVGKSRFSDDRFVKIIGIDNNLKCIEKANADNSDERFVYHEADIESAEFSLKLENIMKSNNVEGFDVIFIAHVLLHLKDPLKFIRVIRKYLNDDGIIIIRGADDGSKLSYGDEKNLVDKIIDFTLKIKGVSDRHSGRKLYSYFDKAGFKNVKMYSFMRDTSDMSLDERLLLFNESFSYRINDVRRHYENDPTDAKKKEEFYMMEELLAQLEEKFYERGFWYCEYDYIGVGRK